MEGKWGQTRSNKRGKWGQTRLFAFEQKKDAKWCLTPFFEALPFGFSLEIEVWLDSNFLAESGSQTEKAATA